MSASFDGPPREPSVGTLRSGCLGFSIVNTSQINERRGLGADVPRARHVITSPRDHASPCGLTKGASVGPHVTTNHVMKTGQNNDVSDRLPPHGGNGTPENLSGDTTVPIEVIRVWAIDQRAPRPEEMPGD